ncbi:hypothetical protein BDF19DRAFT_445659 [Syncephalis fuscata]|nr:hypothetical protein BDF19DRAFT_445659 [Syncephalis fuscata]
MTLNWACRIAATITRPWQLFPRSGGVQCRYGSGIHYYRKQGYKNRHPPLLSTKSPEALTAVEQDMALNPLVSILKSPLRLCLFSRRMQPYKLMIRFVKVIDPETEHVWFVPDGLGGQARRRGVGYWLTGRHAAIDMLKEKSVQGRINVDAFIRSDMAEFVGSLLARDVALEMRRLVQACIIHQMRLRKSTQAIKDDKDANSAITIGKQVVNQPNPCLFYPAPTAVFDSVNEVFTTESKLPVTRHYNGYLIIPATSTVRPITNKRFEAGNSPIFDFGEILTVKELEMIRGALGLRKTNKTTLRLALLCNEETQSLVIALWRWQFYYQ